ncbi:MAG: DUF4097 family beta strand repeat protein [bacterium]|nr:MAG: DUF4097 family beta strand repeat protein [bacterium]
MKRITTLCLVVFLACIFVAGDSFAGRERVLERDFKVKAGKRLTLDLDTGGSLVITGWDKDMIFVHVEIGGKHRDEVEIDFDEGSSGLEIHSYYDRRKRNRSSNVDFEINVPDRFDISIDSKGGSIEIRSVEGQFKGKTMGGGIELEGLRGKVRLKTYGGSITVEDSELDGKVETMGGSVRIEDVVGDLKGSTMGGKVTYRNVRSSHSDDEGEEISITTPGGDIEADYKGRKVHAKTMGGDIDISSDEDVHATTMGGDIDVGKGKEVNVTTFGGDINVEEAPAGAKVKTMGGDIKIGSAGEYVRATTMGGDIEIDAVDGWIKAKTMGGDVTVTMVGDPDRGKRDVEITSMSGDIILEVPSGLSMEFDIELAYTKKSRRNYKIKSDFEMNIEETDDWEWKLGSPRKYIYGTGKVRGGKHMIKIRTINGNIYIREG